MTTDERCCKRAPVQDILSTKLPAVQLLSYQKPGVLSIAFSTDFTRINEHIGGRPDTSKWYVGILDEFAIFNRALDEREIAQMMQSLSEVAVESAGKITNTWGQIKSRD